MYCNCISRCCFVFFFFSSRRRHTRLQGDWSSDVCSSDLVRVEDAHGAPPTIPFWRGEAPSRTQELSAEVAAIRQEIVRGLPSSDPAISHQPFDRLSLRRAQPSRAPSKVEGLSAISWLEAECGL